MPLPLCLAEADPDAIATLAAAGITTFGAAFALPRAALARRVGTDFVDLLDRIRGLAPEVRPLFVPPPRYTGKLDLPAPVANVEALAFAVNRLVFEMAGWLTGRRLGVIAMSLTLAHERYVGVATGVRATCVRFSLAAPAREPAHLSRCCASASRASYCPHPSNRSRSRARRLPRSQATTWDCSPATT